MVANVLDAVADAIHVDDDDMEIYTSGATNIFKYPELSDKTREPGKLISAFEEKQQLTDLVQGDLAQETIPAFRYISEMNSGSDHERLQCCYRNL